MSQAYSEPNHDGCVADSTNSIFLVADGPVDTTVRPARPALRRKPRRPGEGQAPPPGGAAGSEQGPRPT
jgi:hypothetical protein